MIFFIVKKMNWSSQRLPKSRLKLTKIDFQTLKKSNDNLNEIQRECGRDKRDILRNLELKINRMYNTIQQIMNKFFLSFERNLRFLLNFGTLSPNLFLYFSQHARFLR
jgi:hypothetical protein